MKNKKEKAFLIVLDAETHAWLIRAAKEASRSTRAQASFLIKKALERLEESTET